MNKKRQWLVWEILEHINSDNQDTTQFLRTQNKTLNLHPSGLDVKLKSTSAVVVTKSSQDISV